MGSKNRFLKGVVPNFPTLCPNCILLRIQSRVWVGNHDLRGRLGRARWRYSRKTGLNVRWWQKRRGRGAKGLERRSERNGHFTEIAGGGGRGGLLSVGLRLE